MIGLVSFKIHVLICGSTFVDKDKNLELDMFVCLILEDVFIMFKLTRLFWPNTCLVSMCITGSRGAANKQV